LRGALAVSAWMPHRPGDPRPAARPGRRARSDLPPGRPAGWALSWG